MKIVLIGAGQRGMIYARCMHEKGQEITAVAEIDPVKRGIAQQEFGIAPERCYESAQELLREERLGDAAIIATMDRDHYAQAIPAMEKGYHLLLEKPVSPIPEEALEIEETAVRTGRHVVVCHVLRYSPFFRAIKQCIDSGMIGRVITIQHNENIGNYHIAHSFVRGNWRRSDISSPMIMQKSCHDMDLLVWLTGSRCRSVASFGGLTYFKAENAPEGAAQRCADCPHQETCRFSAYRCYLPVMGSWPATVLTENQTEEGLREAIRTGPYGRCVYHCDNNVCDHQVCVLEFENGITATFNLSGFTNRMARTLKIMGEDGEIRASEYENTIEVTRFAANAVECSQSTVIHPDLSSSGHGGGDGGIVEDFLALLEGKQGAASSDIRNSVESHMMACAAEEARQTGTVVRIADFRRRHERKPQE
ncbi:MAG: Gfo/Idh/MocA family oxidoreductase [Clostridia bacterium]|nr:Gfo/Idh/MocA family oxidoreductase [Clostridia bacterium]